MSLLDTTLVGRRLMDYNHNCCRCRSWEQSVGTDCPVDMRYLPQSTSQSRVQRLQGEKRCPSCIFLSPCPYIYPGNCADRNSLGMTPCHPLLSCTHGLTAFFSLFLPFLTNVTVLYTDLRPKQVPMTQDVHVNDDFCANTAIKSSRRGGAGGIFFFPTCVDMCLRHDVGGLLMG
jgi:hypothetical protein